METYTLVQFSPEEATAALEKYESFLKDNNFAVVVNSQVGEDNKIEVQKLLLKRIPVKTPVVEAEIVPTAAENTDAPTVDAEIAQPE
jgi:hypothetical protein